MAKSKVGQEYERKPWYRILKSLYIFFFGITLLVANMLMLEDSHSIVTFIVTNAIIIFLFGTIEGLFWYIARGKWGYPKE